MFYVIFKDEGRLCVSSKTFTDTLAAEQYATTISPSREPEVVGTFSRVEEDGSVTRLDVQHRSGPTFTF